MGNRKQIEVESIWLNCNGNKIEYVPREQHEMDAVITYIRDNAKMAVTKKCPVKFETKKLYGIMNCHCYRHFKGDKYYVTGVSLNATTGDYMVEYCGYDQNNFQKCNKYCRPISDFFADISDLYSDDVNTTKQIYRFELDDNLVTEEHYKKYANWYPAKEELTHETL